VVGTVAGSGGVGRRHPECGGKKGRGSCPGKRRGYLTLFSFHLTKNSLITVVFVFVSFVRLLLSFRSFVIIIS